MPNFYLFVKSYVENKCTLEYNNDNEVPIHKWGGLSLTAETLKKLDKRINKLPYPFGENYPAFRRLFIEAAQQENMPLQDAIRQYVGWKYSKK